MARSICTTYSYKNDSFEAIRVLTLVIYIQKYSKALSVIQGKTNVKDYLYIYMNGLFTTQFYCNNKDKNSVYYNKLLYL